MTIDNNGMKIHVTLPRDYSQKLDNVFDDELLVATYKWFDGRVQKKYGKNEYEWIQPFSDEQIETIRKNSFQQLINKMSQLTKEEWSPEQEKFTIHVITESFNKKEFFLDGETTPRETQLFARVKGDIIIVDENSENAVSLQDFYHSLLNLIEEWLRTAVFYCVGSYV